METSRSEPQRVQQRRTKGWRKPENTVSVARPGRWGNPFVIGRNYHVLKDMGWGGQTWRPAGPFNEFGEVVKINDAADAVRMYRAWMASCLTTAKQKTDLSPLRGKNLMCFCPLDQPCHADVLLELANGDPR